MPNELEFLIYKTPEENIKINALLNDEILWLTKKGMAEWFATSKQNIGCHLNNCFSEGELEQNSVVKEILTTANDCKNYRTNFCSLDAIISVGYRVNSRRATQFRIWVTNVLKEYIKKGFVLDDERLKQGERVFGKDYYKELLERVRFVRVNERRIYGFYTLTLSFKARILILL